MVFLLQYLEQPGGPAGVAGSEGSALPVLLSGGLQGSRVQREMASRPPPRNVSQSAIEVDCCFD